jgi:hypothetical protein
LTARWALLATLFAAACGDPSVRSDWERQNESRLEKEARDPVPAPPAFPRRENLVEIAVRGATDFRFYVDGATLGVGDGVVRYVLVARSPEGVENVSFEAIRCATAEYRVYALGRADRTWGGRAGAWRPVAERPQPWHTALQRDYFCPQRRPILSAEEGLLALRQGGHPFAKGFSGDALRER